MGKKLLTFITLAYGFSWAISVPLAINYLSGHDVDYRIHYVTAFGPLLAAILTTLIYEGFTGLRGFLSKILEIKINLAFVLSILSPIALFLFAGLVVTLMGNQLDITNIGDVNFLGNIGILPSLILWIITFGFGEETGWRGFALGELNKRFSMKLSTTILAIVWFCWHLPFFIYNGNLSEGGIFGIAMYALSLFCGNIVLSYLIKLNENRILAVAVWHGVFNWFTASRGLPAEIPTIMSIVVVFWAIQIWRKGRTLGVE